LYAVLFASASGLLFPCSFLHGLSSWQPIRIKVDIKEQGEKFNPEMVRPLSFQRYSSCSYPNGYKIADVGAFKPGQLGTAVEGELLRPLSSWHGWLERVTEG